MDKKRINRDADAIERQQRLEILRARYSYRTTSERLAPFRRLFTYLSYILQILSASLAAGGVLLLSKYFANSVFFVVGFTVVLLLALEAFKRRAYSEFNRQRVSGERVLFTIVLFCALSAGASVLSSKLGAPHLVEFLAVSPPPADIHKIKDDHAAEVASVTAYWRKMQAEADAHLADIKTAASRKNGSIRSHAVAAFGAASNRAGRYQDSLAKYTAAVYVRQADAINKAEAEALQAEAVFVAWRSSFGFWVAWLSIGFEALFFALLYWLADFDARELNEIKAEFKDAPKENIKYKALKTKDATKDGIKDAIKDAAFNNQDAAQIGFNRQNKDDIKDGVIIPPVPPKKAPRVQIVIDGGKVKQYTLGGLKNLINASTPERAAELAPYLKKLKNYE